jgi:DNA repair exonuclease SbcCD nuclease subunit
MRFIHTADWQIGKVFKRFGDREALFRDARLAAVDAIGELAIREQIHHVLVAGDIYDVQTPLPTTLRAPLERMRRFERVSWWLLPGNHDPHRPKGIWEQIAGADLPPNVRPLLTPQPVEIAPGAFVLPSPLTRRADSNDLTAWMNDAPTPPGALRIGLAHGSVTGFDSEGEASNLIDPARPERAGLSYLALGDWHRTLRINDRVWYAGTPEPDRVDSQEYGKVLVVDAKGASERPAVREEVVGRYRWLGMTSEISDEQSVADLEERVRGVSALPSLVLRLRLSGAVSLAVRRQLAAITARLEAAVCHLDVDDAALRTRPTLEDLERIDFDGALRRVAETLQQRLLDPSLAPDDIATTEDALIRLYLLVSEGASA